MDAILQALGGLLLKAVPTFVLVVLLTIYLKQVFFKPLERVLDERYRATEGARKLAEESLEKAAAKTAEYDAALRHARAEVYQAQEELHRRLAAERAGQVQQARLRTEQTVNEARAQLAADAEAAKSSLAAEADALAEKISDAILRRRPA